MPKLHLELNLPNQLTLLRVILTPVFVALLLSDSSLHKQLSLVVFIVAALTDWDRRTVEVPLDFLGDGTWEAMLWTDGVNADNIKQVLTILRDRGYDGVLSLECEGQGGPMIEQSLAWVRDLLSELGIKEEKA